MTSFSRKISLTLSLEKKKKKNIFVMKYRTFSIFPYAKGVGRNIFLVHVLKMTFTLSDTLRTSCL